ncbi:PP2C family protein-serine/threonine phosphatase [Actinokineospora sp. 24-640]
MCEAGQERDPRDRDSGPPDATFAALLEDSAEELYETAPCGYLSTLMDGTIAKVNATLLDWLGLTREAVVGRKRFADLLSVGGRLYHETHFAPLLRMQGKIGGIALEMKTGDGGRMPVLISSSVKHGATGEPMLIRTTIFDARDRRAYEQELLRRQKESEQGRKRADADRVRLQEALAVLQQSLLPAALPTVPGLEAAAYYHTASPEQLGGDFYDLFPIGEQRWAFFLGDVCGKGPQAAAVTSLVRHTLHAAAMHDHDPIAVLTTLNTVLLDHYGADDPRFCSAIVGTLRPGPDSFTVHLASGGHPPALLLRADGDCRFLPTPDGVLVGVLPEPRFTPVATTLAPGDTLLLYTDGLTEARVGRAFYGERALRAFVAEHAGAPPQAVVTALTGLLEGFGDGVNDDTALLAFGVPTQVHDPGVLRPR